MSVRVFAAALLALSVLFASEALCGPLAYLITLKNGSTLTVDSYSIEGRKLVVSYPLGNAELELSSVSSIRACDGKTDLFTDKGEHVLVKGPSGSEKQAVLPASAALTYPNDAQPPEQTGAPSIKAFSNRANGPGGAGNVFGGLAPDARAGEINSFIDAYFSSDDKQREAGNMDAVFSSFFEDDTDQAGAEGLK